MKALGLKIAIITGAESGPISLTGLQLLIEQVEPDNDYVIVDAGAFSYSPDAAAVTSSSDTVVLVTQMHRASNKQIKKAVQQLQIADIPLLGVALVAGKPQLFWKK
jgi:Mrp family chromosome partitioning ATPase